MLSRSARSTATAGPSCLPARRYDSAGNSDRNVSVRLSVRSSRADIVSKRRHDFFNFW